MWKFILNSFKTCFCKLKKYADKSQLEGRGQRKGEEMEGEKEEREGREKMESKVKLNYEYSFVSLS